MQSAILNGDSETGVTIMKVALEVDAGDIILQEKIPLNDEYLHEIEEKLAILGGKMLKTVINQYIDGSATFTPQDNERAVKVGKLGKEDGRLDFSKSADEVINRVRALGEDVGCYFLLNGSPIKTDKVRKVEEKLNLQPFEILKDKKRFVIGCKDGGVEILTCKAPSGKMVSGRDYINGHNEILGTMVN